MANPFGKGPEKDPHEITCPKCFGNGTLEDDKGKQKTCDRRNGKGRVLSQK